MPAHFKWTDEAMQDMITSYQNGESIASIASRYHANHHTVSSMQVEQGIVLRTRAEFSRECTCNHAYFHHIDTEEKAYWLGFLTADGCITTGHRISVHLGTIDCSHLYKLKTALNATHKVSINIRSCKFVVRSPEIAADLAQYGILPNKTFSTKPFQVAPELIRHYWRGILDGDGHISKDGESLTLVGAAMEPRHKPPASSRGVTDSYSVSSRRSMRSKKKAETSQDLLNMQEFDFSHRPH